MSNWTPGPWRVEVVDVDGQDLIGVTSNSLPEQAKVCACGYGESILQSKRDAHLIAAAPDMYEALVRMVHFNDAGCVKQARDALAKARGEEQ